MHMQKSATATLNSPKNDRKSLYSSTYISMSRKWIILMNRLLLVYIFNCCYLLLFYPIACAAEHDSYIKIEEFEPRPGRVALTYGATAWTTDQRGQSAAPQYWTYALHGASLASSIRSSGLTASTGLRYNVANVFNVSASLRGGTTLETRLGHNAPATYRSWAAIEGVSVGADTRLPFSTDRLLSAVFVSAGRQGVSSGGRLSGAGITVGGDVWWISDPIILGATATWSFTSMPEQRRGVHSPEFYGQGLRRDIPGRTTNLFTLTPNISFAANPDLSLQWGLALALRMDRQWTRAQPSPPCCDVATAANLGVSYALSGDTLLSVTTSIGVSGGRTTQIGFSMTHRL